MRVNDVLAWLLAGGLIAVSSFVGVLAALWAARHLWADDRRRP